MIKTNFLRGTGVALVTPFQPDKRIDFASLSQLVDHVIEGGVEYLVVLGTTGESVVLSQEEKQAVLAHVREANNHRVPMVLGIGGNNTADVLKTIDEQDFTGIDAILSVCPYYNKPNQDGLYAHFAEIATASPVPVILYNVPGRTGSYLQPQTTRKLAENFSQIAAIKEASGELENIMQIIAEKPSGFIVLSGDDGLTLPLMSIGVEGVISVTANAAPWQMSEMVRSANQGNFQQAITYHYRLLNLFKLHFIEGNPAGVKAALTSIGIVKNELRLPLTPVSQEVFEQISVEMQHL